jgi:DNA-binding transcriptional regulator LsrR (DeoR family)
MPPDLTRVIPHTRRFPREVRAALPRVLRAFFEESSPAYKEIFIGPEALIDRVDVLVTSVGGSNKPMGFCNDDLLKVSGLSEERVGQLVIGDVGGVLLPARGLSARDAATVEGVNAMWTGIQRRHLEGIARRAAQRRTPGIILITLGASRSAIVLEAIREGLCSELMIDRDLATALRRELAHPLQTLSAPS